MVTKKKILSKLEDAKEIITPIIFKEEIKEQYENRREFEITISERTYYNFNWFNINRKFRKMLDVIKNKFKCEKSKSFNEKYPLVLNFKIKIYEKVWLKYIEIWNYYINKEFSYENFIGYENYLNFIQVIKNEENLKNDT